MYGLAIGTCLLPVLLRYCVYYLFRYCCYWLCLFDYMVVVLGGCFAVFWCLLDVCCACVRWVLFEFVSV